MAQYRLARMLRADSVAWRSGSAGALQAQGRGFKSLRDHHENVRASYRGALFVRGVLRLADGGGTVFERFRDGAETVFARPFDGAGTVFLRRFPRQFDGSHRAQ